MAEIKSLEQRKHQNTLLIIGIGILLIAAMVLYFGFWQEEVVVEDTSLEAVEPDKKTSLILEAKLIEIDLDFTFLEKVILPFLKSHGDLPVEKGETGRINPFIPY